MELDELTTRLKAIKKIQKSIIKAGISKCDVTSIEDDCVTLKISFSDNDNGKKNPIGFHA